MKTLRFIKKLDKKWIIRKLYWGSWGMESYKWKWTRHWQFFITLSRAYQGLNYTIRDDDEKSTLIKYSGYFEKLRLGNSIKRIDTNELLSRRTFKMSEKLHYIRWNWNIWMK